MRNTYRYSLTLIGWLALGANLVWAQSVDSVAPYHLEPDDHFTINLNSVSLSSGDTVSINFNHIGTGSSTPVTAESFATDTVGVRVPASAELGQYTLGVTINGSPASGSADIWVRELPFRMIRESSGHLPSQATGVHFKDADFGDVDNDGFLDIFEAVSKGPINNDDRLYINQLGKPSARDCSGISFFCDQTSAQFDQSPGGGLADNNRTYDADLADLDLDGDLDLVRVDNKGDANLRILFNDGSGNFDDQTLTAIADYSTMNSILGRGVEADVGDANGDGMPDIIVCNWSSGSQNVLLINELVSSNQFVVANDSSCDPSSPSAHALCKIRDYNNRGCAFGQFDGAGGLDIYFSSIDNSQGDVVLLHTGNTGNVPQYSVEENWVVNATGGTPQTLRDGDVKVADLDGDGDDDVVVNHAQSGENRRRILWNDAGTRLVELDGGRFPESGNDYDADLSDLDGDGDLDVIFGNRNAALGFAILNKGGANEFMKFESTPSTGFWMARSPGGIINATSAMFSFGLSVSAGDFDLDGDRDLLTGGFDRMSLWTNDLYQQPGQARDWVFILDKTRSMVSSSRDFFEPAKNVLATFSTQRRDDDAVGFVTFDYTGSDTGNTNAPDDINKAQRVVEVGDQNYATLADTIRATTLGACSGFCTAIGWAIKTGNDMAADAPVVDPGLPREQVLVLATDGQQNQAPHPDTIIPTLPAHVRLYTIALGSDTDDRMLSALATNGGKFYFAGRSDDYTSVQNVLREVHNDMEADATGKQAILPLQDYAWSKGYFATIQESPIFHNLFKARNMTLNDISTAIAPGVVAGQKGWRYYFYVDPQDREARFTANWRNISRTAQMRLINPRGDIVDPATDDKVKQQRWTRALSTKVLDPLSGVWVVELFDANDLGPVKATGLVASDLFVAGEAEQPRFYPAESIVIALGINEAIPGIRADARCISPSKVQRLVQTSADANGNIRIDCGAADENGSWDIDVLVYGPPSRPFVRSWKSAVYIHPGSDDELDLRKATITLSSASVTAGGSDTTTATLHIQQLDGQPLTGARVGFVVTGGKTQGPVVDHGDGSYSQKITGGAVTGTGRVSARVSLEKLRQFAEYEINPSEPDTTLSSLEVITGPLRLCTNQSGHYRVQAGIRDANDNPVPGANVVIYQAAGHPVHWVGETNDLVNGGYDRAFMVPWETGEISFAVSVNGVEFPQQPRLTVFDPSSPEGIASGCTGEIREERPPGDDCVKYCKWWIILLCAIILMLSILLFIVARRKS
jgi:hypothetical protein